MIKAGRNKAKKKKTTDKQLPRYVLFKRAFLLAEQGNLVLSGGKSEFPTAKRYSTGIAQVCPSRDLI
jgi:hypothetical protein